MRSLHSDYFGTIKNQSINVGQILEKCEKFRLLRGTVQRNFIKCLGNSARVADKPCSRQRGQGVIDEEQKKIEKKGTIANSSIDNSRRFVLQQECTVNFETHMNFLLENNYK